MIKILDIENYTNEIPPLVPFLHIIGLLISKVFYSIEIDGITNPERVTCVDPASFVRGVQQL